MSDSSPLLLRTDSQSTEQNEIESTSTPVRQFSDQEGEFSSFVPMAPLAASKQGKKRSMEFHDLFKSISVEEELLDSWACALSRDILIQGRMYLSEQHLCFHANIIGWVTNVVLSLKDIVGLEKKSTAVIFPNAIQISTLHGRYFFTSFISRDPTFKRIHDCWQVVLVSTTAMMKSTGSVASRQDHQDKHMILGNDIFSDNLLHDSSVIYPLDGFSASIDETSSSKIIGTDSPGGTSSIQLDSSGIASQAHHLRENGHIQHGCQCMHHYPLILLNTTISGASAEQIKDLLMGTSSLGVKFYSVFFDSVQMQGQWSTRKDLLRWQMSAVQVLRRCFSMHIPLPQLAMNKTKGVFAQFEEYEIYSEEITGSFSFESSVVLDDLPGGTCLIHLRTCVVDREPIGVVWQVTALVEPPRKAWLKKSIERSMHRFMLSYYKEMASLLVQAISDHSILDQPHSKRSISWLNADDASFMNAKPAEVSESANQSDGKTCKEDSVQSYFDWAFFKKSMVQLSPIVLAFLIIVGSWIYQRHNSKSAIVRMNESERTLRLQHIEKVYSKLHVFLQTERQRMLQLEKKHADVMNNVLNVLEKADIA